MFIHDSSLQNSSLTLIKFSFLFFWNPCHFCRWFVPNPFISFALIQAGDSLIQLYQNFITDFETKINLLKLAHFAVIVSRRYSEKDAAISYLEGVIEKLRTTSKVRIEEPILYINMQIGLFKLELGDQKECKKLLEEGKSTLDSMTDIDPSVYASYYWISSQYHKARQEFAEFYRSALLYLAYTSVETLSESFKLVCYCLQCWCLIIHTFSDYEKIQHSVVQ